MQNNLKNMTYTSLLIAVVFICTVVIMIPSPLGGYVNLGDLPIYIASFFLGPILGFIAGGLGSALGDIYLGFIPYALPTLIIKGSMGLISGYFFKKDKHILGIACGFITMVVGYYVFEVFLYGNMISPIANIPYNLIQGSLGAVGGYLLIKAFQKTGFKVSLGQK